MADSDVRGQFVWYELLTSDPQGAVPFYTKVMGWATQAWEGGDPSSPYTMLTNGGAPVGGVMKLPKEAVAEGAPPHWLGYVSTPDVDATAKRAGELGSRILVQPTDIPGAGRFAVIMDPQGAVFGIYKSASGSPDHGAPAAGEFSWHELVTNDYVRAFEFYADLFGWIKIAAHDMGPMGMYQIFGRSGQTLGGMFNKPKEMPAPPHWLYYVLVNDIDEMANKVKSNGGKILHGPVEVPGGDWIAQCSDPQGAAFALHAKKR